MLGCCLLAATATWPVLCRPGASTCTYRRCQVAGRGGPRQLPQQFSVMGTKMNWQVLFLNSTRADFSLDGWACPEPWAVQVVRSLSGGEGGRRHGCTHTHTHTHTYRDTHTSHAYLENPWHSGSKA